ncbi:MAG: Gfo/Idh/MocA family oxidoreductase [Schlesneria sp.]
MVDQSRRDRVGLGLIGLGPSWEQRYLETLVRLQSRLTIRLVYDPVEARAKSVASEFDAEVAGSLRQMLARPKLQGLLVLDPGWLGAGALSLIAGSGKPVFLANPTLRQPTALRALLQTSPSSATEAKQANTADDLCMPELGLRFTPSTCRLRELIATKLGRVKRILIECDLSAEKTEIAHIVDWCHPLMGQSPTVISRANGQSNAVHGVDFEFSSALTPINTRTARLQQKPAGNGFARFSIECERGHATLTNRTHIHWKTPTDSADEYLVDERSETEILIDQFCRRALGGLNPVGRLSEFVRAINLVESFSSLEDAGT